MDLKTVTEQLNAIKRTCLFCNSQKELADMTEIPSLVHNNNFDKIGEDKRISLYDSFNEEYQKYANTSSASLNRLMKEYEKTSEFFTSNELAKWKALSEKETILEILRCVFYSHELPRKNRRLKEFIAELYDHEDNRFRLPGINISILILIAYRILPTYKSKKGAVTDIKADYARVKDLLDTFHEQYAFTEANIIIDGFEERISKEEIKLNRLALLTMFDDVVYTIDSGTDRTSIQDSYRYFDIDGMWIDKINPNVCYEIIQGSPTYKMTAFEIHPSEVYFTKYSLEITASDDESSLTLFTTHPKGRAKYSLMWIRGEKDCKLGSLDFSSHRLTFNNYKTPTEIILEDIERHNNYDFNAKKLYKLSEKEAEKIADTINSKTLKDKYEKYKTEYYPYSRIYAITRDFIYITPHDTESDFLYKVSRDSYMDKGILGIGIDDTAGLAVIAQEGPFIGFESIGLYIDIGTEEKLNEAGIERVRPNEIE